MFARCGKCLVVAALILAIGGHWAALQTVAWTTMLVNNLRTQSFTEAVSDTFDGEHPCCMCKAIAAGKKAEKESEAVAPVLKLEFLPAAESIVLFAPASFQLLPQNNFFADTVSFRPPFPPPRSFFV